jgi:hypothetical protein
MSKITAYNAITDATPDDLLYIVDAPGSVPVSNLMLITMERREMA